MWTHLPLESLVDMQRKETAMNERDELFTRAAPPCRDCDAPVTRVEHSWTLDEEWRVRAFMVCARGCRVMVEEGA